MQIISAGEHQLNPELIDLNALQIIYRLQKYGYEAYIVGGGVRDLLLNKKPKDFDIATSATPSQVRKLFRNCRIIGKRFKLAHIYFRGNKIIEVATFRGENPEPGEFQSNDNDYGNIETDAERRDLSINALFYNPATEEIIDYVNGYNDLRERVIRIIGTPVLRFQEDPVRITRTLRHQARSGFYLHPDTEKAIKSESGLIQDCSTMRIYEEFKKDLTSGYFQEIFLLLQKYNLLKYFLPEIATAIDSKKINLQDLMFCIKGIDRAALENRLTSEVPALAILTLFTHPEFDLHSPLQKCFIHKQGIQEFTPQALKPLLVPRRNKHHIGDLFKQLWNIEQSQKKNRPFILKDKRLKTELKLLLNLLNIDKVRTYLNKVFRF